MKGVYIVSDHAKMVANGKKTLIVKKRPLPEDYIGVPVYIVDKDYIWAKVRIAEPFEISLAEFRELERKHTITGQFWLIRLFAISAREPKIW